MILDKYKGYPFPLENALNLVIYSMKFIFRSDFREMSTSAFPICTHGKWEIEFTWIEGRFNFEIWSAGTFIPLSLKIGSRGFV